MANIIIIRVGHSQTQVIKTLHESIPDAKCISITMGHNYNLPSDDENIIHYNLAEHSRIVQRIISLQLMPGSARMMTEEHMKDIMDEQIDDLTYLLQQIIE